MKKLLCIMLCLCTVLSGCGEQKEVKQDEPQKTEMNNLESTIKTDVADFCSDIELFMACFNSYLASPDEQMKDDGDQFIKKAKEIYEGKIEKSNYDSARINDIKYSSYTIISQSEQMWNNLKEGKIKRIS